MCILHCPPTREAARNPATPDIILNECRMLVENGVREITLLGQNVNSFGQDKGGAGVTFADLLRSVAAIDGLDRLRFTTSHPKDIAPEVITAFGELGNLCPLTASSHAGRIGPGAQSHAPQIRHATLSFHSRRLA